MYGDCLLSNTVQTTYHIKLIYEIHVHVVHMHTPFE